VYDNFSRVPVEEVQAGDICALTGISDIGVSVPGGGCAAGGGGEGGTVSGAFCAVWNSVATLAGCL
jgi:hypothetical protein